MKTIRLNYPQWQGAIINEWFPGYDAADISRGYALGTKIINLLLPPTQDETYTVPVRMDYQRKVQDGVMDRDIIREQTKAALNILNIARPDKILTIGGECSVSVVPFTWLCRKYEGDVAMIWIDAHPDITLPGDPYAGYHAMAVTAAMGLGDRQIISLLPAKFPAEKILYVGLRNWEREQIKERHKAYGTAWLSPQDVTADNSRITDWLSRCGARNVVVHLDLDVLDATKTYLAVGNDPDGLTLEQVAKIINSIAEEKTLVGLTVAEYMPRHAIKLQGLLRRLPL